MVIRFLLILLLALPLPAGLEFGDQADAACGSSADVDNLSGLTISTWAIFTGSAGTPEKILMKSDDLSKGWYLGFQNGVNMLQWYVYSDEGYFRRYSYAAGDDTLYHIAATWTGNFGTADDELDIWVDGSEVDSGGTDRAGSYVDDDAVVLSISHDHPNLDLNGMLQCVALWEGVLSDNSIKSLAAGGCRTALRVQEGTPLRYWEMMDGQEGDTVTGADSILELTRDEHCSTSDNLTFRATEIQQ